MDGDINVNRDGGVCKPCMTLSSWMTEEAQSGAKRSGGFV